MPFDAQPLLMMCTSLLFHQEGAGLALQGLTGLVKRGNQGGAASGVLHEADARLYLGQHAAGGKVALLDVLAVGHQAVYAVPAEEPDEALDDLNALGSVAVPPLGQQPEQQGEGHVLVGHAE